MVAPSSLPLFFLPSLSSFLPLFLVCACVSLCVVCAHMCICRCMQRLEIGIRCSALSLSSLFPWDRVSHWVWSYTGCLQAKESFISAPNGVGVSGICTAKPDFAHGHWGFEPKHSRLYSINILTHLNSPQQLALSYFLYVFLRSGRNNSGSKNLRG